MRQLDVCFGILVVNVTFITSKSILNYRKTDYCVKNPN